MSEQFKVGDGFFVFGSDGLGGYELERRWVKEVENGRIRRHFGGAVESGHEGPGLPWRGDVEPKKAFMKGKKLALEGYRSAKAKLRADMKKLVAAEKKTRALRFKDVPVRGGKETFAEKLRNWELDF